ncbi:MAG: recombinase family protein, partial [Nanoarchaeota archaeon]|nr:recombinase family protein [Nanoarchaeota archaeon]
DELRKYATGHDMDVVKVYKDNTSGTDPERESINKLLDDLENGTFDVVLATERDRLSRDPGFMGYIKFSIKRANKELIIINEPPSKTEYDELIEGVIELFASFETKRRMRRIIRGKKKAKEGMRVMYRAPFGYDNTKPYPTPNKDAETVKQIFQDKIKGVGYTQMAEKYNLSSRGRVSKILHNKFYTGMVKIDGKWVQGKHHGIVTEEMFQKIESNSLERVPMREGLKQVARERPII